jgi:hypothetical protein
MKKLLLFLILILGCNEKKIQTGFPFDIQEKNIAALFTMTNENGRIENLRMMESIFQDKSLGFECESHHNKPSKYIYEKLTELSAKVGSHGTLLIYLNSHGGGSGSNFGMTASDQFFKFSKALGAIAKGNKVKRLIVLVDTCHASGSIREGFQGNEQPILNIKTGMYELPDFYQETIEPSKMRRLFGNFTFETKIEIDYGKNSGAYEECLIIASSSAADLSIRGAFASRLKKTFENFKNKDVTIVEFLKYFASLHSNTNQKPHYKTIPNDFILYEPLFKNLPLREIPIKNRNFFNDNNKYDKDFIPLPKEVL